MTARALPMLLASLLLLGCSAGGRSPYTGMILDFQTGLGAREVDRQAETDPTLHEYVATHPQPDFVLAPAPGTNDLELVYVSESRLVHFHRTAPEEPSVTAELSPLPTALVNILPSSLVSQTPPPLDPFGGGCWTTTPPGLSCRTCCKTRIACSIACEP